MIRSILVLCVVLACSTIAVGEVFDLDALKFPSNDRQAFDENNVPASIRGHLNSTITIRGYMMVSSVTSTTDIKRFGMWAETTQKPVNLNAWKILPLHHMLYVEMSGDRSTELLINRPIEVTGKLTIDVIRDSDGTVGTVYKIQASRVSKATKRDGHFPAAGHGC
ncbi:hypothetical protein [Planctomycetes bacterium K23_9]